MAEGTGSNPTVGQILSQARRAKGVTLEQAAGALNIRPRYLAALEADDWNHFPAVVYGLGFLRSYARYLGLDADALVAQQRGVLQATAKPPREGPGGGPPAGSVRRRSPRSNPATRPASAPPSPTAGRSVGMAVAGLLALIALALVLLHHVSSHPATAALRPPAATSHRRSRRSSPAPARTAPPTSSSAPAAPLVVPLKSAAAQATYAVRQSPFTVQVQFTARCWVGTSQDPAGHIYDPGQVVSFTAARSLWLTFGVADGAQISVAGTALGPAGSTAGVRTLTFVYQ